MSKLDAIKAKAATKEQKKIRCSRCKGSGLVPSHVDHGRCFKCNGVGVVPNKWMKIAVEVEALQKTMARYAERIQEAKDMVASRDTMTAREQIRSGAASRRWDTMASEENVTARRNEFKKQCQKLWKLACM